MKKLLKTSIGLSFLITIAITSCNKEGKGGTSSISGEVKSTEIDKARNEITEIIISNGNTIEHGDYWILNTESTAAYFYIWYNNPTWTSDGDPYLSGRTGIEVAFNYSDSNTEVAQNTADAILAATTAFDIQMLNDILRITTIKAGDTPDADKITSPFEINIEQQGKDRIMHEQLDAIDEKVYIIYGENGQYNDVVRTGADGKFEFTNLTKGNYEVYVFSEDTISDALNTVQFNAEITSNKSITDIGTFEIYK